MYTTKTRVLPVPVECEMFYDVRSSSRSSSPVAHALHPAPRGNLAKPQSRIFEDKSPCMHESTVDAVKQVLNDRPARGGVCPRLFARLKIVYHVMIPASSPPSKLLVTQSGAGCLTYLEQTAEALRIPTKHVHVQTRRSETP